MHVCIYIHLFTDICKKIPLLIAYTGDLTRDGFVYPYYFDTLHVHIIISHIFPGIFVSLVGGVGGGCLGIGLMGIALKGSLAIVPKIDVTLQAYDFVALNRRVV